MDKLEVNITTEEVITKTYSYKFTDRKGLVVSVNGIPTYKELLKSIKDNTKKLKDYEIVINEK